MRLMLIKSHVGPASCERCVQVTERSGLPDTLAVFLYRLPNAFVAAIAIRVCVEGWTF